MANEDLAAIEKEIAERKQSQEQSQEAATVDEQKPTVPVIAFPPAAAPAVPQAEHAPQSKDKTTELVEEAFNQAVIHRVTTDESVQEELLDSAEKVIRNKTNAIRERADQEDKAAYFNNKKGACECFGYDEETTEKWAVTMMNFWHNIATAIWIVIGFFTFAPITFVAKKIVVIFKKSWIAIIVSILLYLLIVVGIPLLTAFLSK